jgi:GNAT superfamily N-acetyltransferase
MNHEMKKTITIRALQDFEIAIASSLISAEWKFDYEKFQHLHLGDGTYKAFGGFIDNQLICMGDAVINGKSGWLGNIVVKPEFRANGYGQEITMFLINYLKKHSCKTIITMATESSKELYQKLGFLTSSIYCILKGRILNSTINTKQIRSVELKDIDQIYKLDASASGEDRRKLFNNSVKKGYVFISGEANEIQGFFLPESGEGPVIASNEEAGLALLQLKHSQALHDAIIPCENKTAVEYLKKNHFRETAFVYRMALGEDLDWNPEMMFGRVARYCA